MANGLSNLVELSHIEGNNTLPTPGDLTFLEDGEDGDEVDLDDYKGRVDPDTVNDLKRSGLAALSEPNFEEIAILYAPNAYDEDGLPDALMSHCESNKYRFALLDAKRGEAVIGEHQPPERPREPVRRLLLPVDQGLRRRERRAQAGAARRPRGRHLRAHRHRARRLQGAGQRGGARRARARVRGHRRRAGGAQPARRERDPRLPRPRHPRVGRAHALDRPAVEVRQRAAAVHLPRGLDLPGHAVGGVRAQRRPAVGAREADDHRVPAHAVAGRARCSARRRRRRSS